VPKQELTFGSETVIRAHQREERVSLVPIRREKCMHGHVLKGEPFIIMGREHVRGALSVNVGCRAVKTFSSFPKS